MVQANHPRFSEAQLETILLLTRGDMVLTNKGKYVLEEDGVLNEDLSARKPVLKFLATKGLAEFGERKQTLFYRITAAGIEAASPESPWRRPMGAPGRIPRAKPTLKEKPRGGESRKGSLVFFVKHRLAAGRAFESVKDATEFARRIQAGYALANEPVPDLVLEHRRYTTLNRKLLVRILNGDISDDDVIEHWETNVPAYTNSRTYERYEAIQ